MGEQFASRFAVIRQDSHAHAGRRADDVALDEHGVLPQAVEQAARERLRLSGRRFGKQDTELVTADPRHHGGRRELARQEACQARQRFVPRPMSEAVVDRFEVVEVEEQQGRLPAGDPDAGEFALEIVLEPAAVGEAGQRVVVRRVQELSLEPLLLTDVARHGREELDRPVGPAMRDHDLRDGNLLPVFADDDALAAPDALPDRFRHRVVFYQRMQPLGEKVAYRARGQVLLPFDAQETPARGVEIPDPSLRIGGSDDVRRRLENLHEPGPLLFSLAVRRHVGDEAFEGR